MKHPDVKVSDMKKQLISALVAVVAFLGVSVQASALTEWRTVAYTRDNDIYGPYISLSAGINNPEWVRVVVNDGTYAGATNVSVSLDCRDNNFNSFDRSIRQSFALPRSFTWDIPTWVTYCRVYMSAYRSGAGFLAASVQARYP
jgi:hypothetical protein